MTSTAAAANKKTGKCITVGDKIWLKKELNGLKMRGIVRFVGPLKAKPSKNTYYGVELDIEFAEGGKCNGKLSGIQYFLCHQNDTPRRSKIKKHRGLFVSRKQISKSREPTVNTNSFMVRVSVGDSVKLKGYKGEGVVKYVGQPMTTSIHSPVLYGIAMQRSGQGYSHGTYKHKWCFDCKAGQGIFVQQTELKLAPHLRYKQTPRKTKNIIKQAMSHFETLITAIFDFRYNDAKIQWLRELPRLQMWIVDAVLNFENAYNSRLYIAVLNKYYEYPLHDEHKFVTPLYYIIDQIYKAQINDRDLDGIQIKVWWNLFKCLIECGSDLTLHPHHSKPYVKKYILKTEEQTKQHLKTPRGWEFSQPMSPLADHHNYGGGGGGGSGYNPNNNSGDFHILSMDSASAPTGIDAILGNNGMLSTIAIPSSARSSHNSGGKQYGKTPIPRSGNSMKANLQMRQKNSKKSRTSDITSSISRSMTLKSRQTRNRGRKKGTNTNKTKTKNKNNHKPESTSSNASTASNASHASYTSTDSVLSSMSTATAPATEQDFSRSRTLKEDAMTASDFLDMKEEINNINNGKRAKKKKTKKTKQSNSNTLANTKPTKNSNTNNKTQKRRKKPKPRPRKYSSPQLSYHQTADSQPIHMFQPTPQKLQIRTSNSLTLGGLQNSTTVLTPQVQPTPVKEFFFYMDCKIRSCILLKYIRRAFKSSAQPSLTTHKMCEAISVHNMHNVDPIKAAILTIHCESSDDEYTLFNCLTATQLDGARMTTFEFESYIHLNSFPLLHIFSYLFQPRTRFYDELSDIHEPLLIQNNLLGILEFLDRDLITADIANDRYRHFGLCWILVIRDMYQHLIDMTLEEVQTLEPAFDDKIFETIQCYIFEDMSEMYEDAVVEKLAVFTLRHLFDVEMQCWDVEWIAYFAENILLHLPAHNIEHIMEEKIDISNRFTKLERNASMSASQVFSMMKKVAAEKMKETMERRRRNASPVSPATPFSPVGPQSPGNMKPELTSSFSNLNKEKWLKSLLNLSWELKDSHPRSVASLLSIYSAPVSYPSIIRIYMEGDPQLIPIILHLNHNYIVWGHLLFDLMCSAILYPNDWSLVFQQTCEAFCSLLRKFNSQRKKSSKSDVNVMDKHMVEARKQLDIAFEQFFQVFLTAGEVNTTTKSMKNIKINNNNASAASASKTKSKSKEDILDFYAVTLIQVSEQLRQNLIEKMNDLQLMQNAMTYEYSFLESTFAAVKKKIVKSLK